MPTSEFPPKYSDGRQFFRPKCYQCRNIERLGRLKNQPELKRNPVIVGAYQELENAIANGIVVLTGQCEFCPEPAVHNHHPDIVYPLDINECCEECHDKIHACLDRIYLATGYWPEYYRKHFHPKRNKGIPNKRKAVNQLSIPIHT